MIDLVESIITEDYVSASEIFESRLEEIMEQKLYEMKQQIQAESFSNPYRDTQSKKKSGFVRASKKLPDPYTSRLPSLSAKINDTAKKAKKIKQATTPDTDDNDPETMMRQSNLLSKVPKGGLPRLMAKSAAEDPGKKYDRILSKAKDLEARGHRTAVKRLKTSSAGKLARLGKGVEKVGYGIGATLKGLAGAPMRILQGLGEENT